MTLALRTQDAVPSVSLAVPCRGALCGPWVLFQAGRLLPAGTYRLGDCPLAPYLPIRSSGFSHTRGYYVPRAELARRVSGANGMA